MEYSVENQWGLTTQTKSVQNGWLMISSGMTTYPLYIGEYNDPSTGNPCKATRIWWNDRGNLNTAQMTQLIEFWMIIIIIIRQKSWVYPNESNVSNGLSLDDFFRYPPCQETIGTLYLFSVFYRGKRSSKNGESTQIETETATKMVV